MSTSMRHLSCQLLFLPSVVLLVFVLGCFADEAVRTDASKTPEDIDEDGDELVDLDELTDAELEAVCTDRGFELVRETDSDGADIVYTHENYVEAARQCLAIEAEMEKVLEENPEIVDEIQAEAARMASEKERLEKELAAAQEKLDKGHFKEKPAFIDPRGSMQGEHDNENIFNEYVETESDISDIGKEDEIIESIEKGESSTHGPSENESNKTDVTVDAAKEEGEERNISMPDDGGEDEVVGESLDDHQSEESSNGDASSRKDAVSDDVQQMKSDDAEGVDADLNLMNVVRESLLKIQKDVIIVLRPVISAMRPLLRIAKDTGISAAEMLRRYISALLAARKDVKEEVDD